MQKIDFVNGQEPALNEENLNLLQLYIEQAINAQVSGDTLPIGSIIPYPGETAPANWLICDGAEISRTEYANLFAILGTTFGEGDGSTTFKLPNLKGRTIVGLDTSDTDFNEIGKTLGEKTHILTTNEMPSHTHKYTYSISSGNIEGSLSLGNSKEGTITGQYGNAINETGNSQGHNNIQPSIVQNYIIKANQSAGIVATVINNLESTSETDALSAKQGNKLYDLLKKKFQEPAGEFTIFNGNYVGKEDGTYKEIATLYDFYNSLLDKFPLKEGFTRKYKIAMDYTNTNIVNDGHIYVRFANYDTGANMKEYLFDNVWGSIEDGTRKTQIMDFDIETISKIAHFRLKVSPGFGSGADYRIYRVYLIVYDVLE